MTDEEEGNLGCMTIPVFVLILSFSGVVHIEYTSLRDSTFDCVADSWWKCKLFFVVVKCELTNSKHLKYIILFNATVQSFTRNGCPLWGL